MELNTLKYAIEHADKECERLAKSIAIHTKALNEHYEREMYTGEGTMSEYQVADYKENIYNMSVKIRKFVEQIMVLKGQM